MEQPQLGLAELGLARRVTHAVQVVLVTDPGEHRSAVGAAVGSPDDDDGRLGAGRDLQAHGSEHERVESAQTPVADHDGAAKAGGPVQAGHGVAPTEFRGGDQAGVLFLDRGGDCIEQFAAGATDALDGLGGYVEGPAVRVGAVHDVQRTPAAFSLSRCPERGLTGGLGAVDADDDGAEFRVADGVLHDSSSPGATGSLISR